jgi:hypothetical protein
LQYEQALDADGQLDPREIKRLSTAELADARAGLAQATELAK